MFARGGRCAYPHARHFFFRACTLQIAREAVRKVEEGMAGRVRAAQGRRVAIHPFGLDGIVEDGLAFRADRGFPTVLSSTKAQAGKVYYEVRLLTDGKYLQASLPL